MKTLTILLSLLVTGQSFAGELEITLQDALSQGLVEITIQSNGEYKGEAMQIEIQSKTKKDLKLKIPMGLTLVSDDPSLQDQVVTRNYIATIEKLGSKNLKIHTLCIQQHNSSPSEGNVYTVGAMADSEMIKLLRFVKSNPIGISAFQDAVWVLSDKSEIVNVYDDDLFKTKNLQEFLATITNQDVPWYSVEHDEQEPGAIEERTAINIHGVFEFELQEPAQVTLAICNAEGEEVYIIADKQSFKPGRGGLRFKLEVNSVAKGQYFIRLTNGNDVIEERELVI